MRLSGTVNIVKRQNRGSILKLAREVLSTRWQKQIRDAFLKCRDSVDAVMLYQRLWKHYEPKYGPPKFGDQMWGQWCSLVFALQDGLRAYYDHQAGRKLGEIVVEIKEKA